ncbi:MAG: helix-turn-helix transcriptional regulator [Fluviicola sp.]|nr:helix-turn-helix transcriptional regulator [Fluviicola sp.]
MKDEECFVKFGDRVRKRRVHQNISQTQLAFEAKISREYVNRIENGNVNISLAKIIAISEVLDVEVKDLFEF